MSVCTCVRVCVVIIVSSSVHLHRFCEKLTRIWSKEWSVRQWSGRPWSNPKSSHNRLKKWYLMPPCLLLNTIK